MQDRQADPDDIPIAYMQRTRDWYLALGYDNPYRWAHYADVPFHALNKPLSQLRLTLVTTAAPYQAGKGLQGAGAPYNAAVKFYEVYSGSTLDDPDLRIAHVNVDRKHASLEDARCWFPLAALREQAAAGRIGALAARFHGFPTNRSQRHTLEIDCPELLRRCREDGVDAAVLVANCPVCHQSLSLAARTLEQHGIATVIMGCARDVVEHCGVPRFLFSDFPLGSAAGRPDDIPSQRDTLDLALKVLECAPAARTTVQNPLRWAVDAGWKRDYCNPALFSAAELQAMREASDHDKAVARRLRET
ncbi:MAG: reductase [Castellaniella sp.]